MKLRSNRGQILVEYILLMVITISFATMLVKALVSREDGKQGMVVKQWDNMLKKIGNDLPDCPKQLTYATPNCPP